ncbi:MAG: 4-phosphoerythronate dehydrogenase, partial [Planctomycetota bacterium]
AGSKVRFVGTATIGFEHVDVDYLSESNIGFASAPGSNANSVAEYIVAALLSVGQKKGIEIEGKSIGIVGVGNVGSRVEKKARALGMEVYLNDPPLQRQTGDPEYLPIEELYGCDFMSLHTPLTFEGIDRTFHLVDEKFFGVLKPGCVFLNTARGAVTDTGALKAAIQSGKLGGAVLDVWEDEPNIDAELVRMVNLGTPHIAGYSLDGKIAGMFMIYEAACKFFGLQAEYRMRDFLPEPRLKQIEVDPESDGEQQLLHEAVQQLYLIDLDNLHTKEIPSMGPDERGQFFDSLRKNYRVRREFQNTEVMLKCASESLARKLAGIGFKVSRGQG